MTIPQYQRLWRRVGCKMYSALTRTLKIFRSLQSSSNNNLFNISAKEDLELHTVHCSVSETILLLYDTGKSGK